MAFLVYIWAFFQKFQGVSPNVLLYAMLSHFPNKKMRIPFFAIEIIDNQRQGRHLMRLFYFREKNL